MPDLSNVPNVPDLGSDLLGVALRSAIVYVFLVTHLGFSNWSSNKQVLVIASLAGLASVAQTLLILMGGFDLSISGFIVVASHTPKRAAADPGLFRLATFYPGATVGLFNFKQLGQLDRLALGQLGGRLGP